MNLNPSLKSKENPFHGFEFFPGEQVEMVLRKFWFVHLFGILKWLIWVIFPVGLSFFIASLTGMPLTGKAFFILFSCVCMYSAFATLQIFVLWMNGALDVIVVTNDRIVCIDQIDFFHREIVEARLENIQDSSGSIRGFLGTLFNLGEIKIRTANDVTDFSLDFILDPHSRAREIFTLSHKAKEGETGETQPTHTPLPPTL
jgi:hypothetical protein